MIMRNVILGFILMLPLWLFSQTVEVPQEQKPLISKVTASWCPFCGSWGWSFYDDIYEDNGDDAVFLTLHHSGDHTNAISSSVVNNFTVFGQPRFLLDGVDLNVSSSNGTSKRQEFHNLVDQAKDASPMIQTGIDAGYNADLIRVNYAVEAFTDLNGEYYVALYLVERSFIGYQASIGPNAQHKTMLRAELTNQAFGKLAFSGNTPAGSVMGGYQEFPLGAYNPENLQIVSVIWKKEGDQYLVINSNLDDELELKSTSSVNQEYATELEVSLYPTVVKNDLTIHLEAPDRLEEVIVRVFNLGGDILMEEKFGIIDMGKQALTLNALASVPAGIYLLNIHSQSRQWTQRIIIE